MKKDSTPGSTFYMLFAALLLLFSASANPLNGQGTRQASNVERRAETMNQQAKDFERENMGREGKVKNDAETAKRTRRIRLEIEEDLNNLQYAYNGIVAMLNSGRENSHDFAVKAAAGIRKNALRLKTNLALPIAKDDDKAQLLVVPETERKALTALCRNIHDLITNPIFENGAVLDVKNGAKARTDLEKIIGLAESLSN